jgi:hypothetical protein
MMSRIYSKSAHDDEMVCRSCAIFDIAGEEAYIISHILPAEMARMCSKMLKNGTINDTYARNRMHLMQAQIAKIAKTVAANSDESERSELINQRYQLQDNYKAFLIATYKKHMMDKCTEELMQAVWHPSKYSTWKYLLEPELRELTTSDSESESAAA